MDHGVLAAVSADSRVKVGSDSPGDSRLSHQSCHLSTQHLYWQQETEQTMIVLQQIKTHTHKKKLSKCCSDNLKKKKKKFVGK